MKTITEPKIMTLKQALNNYKKSNFYLGVQNNPFVKHMIFFEKFKEYLSKKGIKVKMSSSETSCFVLGRQNTTGSIDRFIEFSEE